VSDPAAVLELPPRLLRPSERFSVAGDILTHNQGWRTRSLPLARLRTFTLGVRRSPYARPVRFARLRFARFPFGQDVETIVCPAGVEAYAAFIRALAEAACDRAPHARFEAEGGRLAGAMASVVALLGAGAAAMAAAAVMSGFAPLGLDLACRLIFLLILAFAITPWIGRGGARRLDPRALPTELLGQT
jgi:hypothetical protein